MATLSPINATYLTLSVILHACCARHGQFEYRTPRRGDVTWNYVAQCYIWRSNWRKTKLSHILYDMRMYRHSPRPSGYYYVSTLNGQVINNAAPHVIVIRCKRPVGRNDGGNISVLKSSVVDCSQTSCSPLFKARKLERKHP